MPIYMDVHILPGIKAKDVAEAHQKDVLLQEEFSCKCITYWVDEKRDNVFCLIEAPDESVVMQLHQKSHGLVPNKIIEVSHTMVESFLGRINDPEEATVTKNGLKVFNDPSLRFILVTKTTDPVLLHHKLGQNKTVELLTRLNKIIRENLAAYAGREAVFEGNSFIASFSSAVKAVSCALAIEKNAADNDMLSTGFKIGIHAGEPVANNEKLFGDTIQMARRICTLCKQQRVIITSTVNEFMPPNYFKNDTNILMLLPREEMVLDALFNALEKNYANPD